MVDTLQASFNSGEWSPKLYSRVDLTKYRSGAALLSNFYVDYRGGASTRPGTKWILQCYKSGTAVRLIPFQAGFSTGYVLEFGDKYIRFYFLGAPILEPARSITGAAAGPPEVFTSGAHGYANSDWIFSQNNYYIIANATTNTFTLTDLFGNALTANPFTLPANAQRVYTIASPYAAADLALVKFAQNVSEMILCHPNYTPYVLTLITATNWSLLPIVIGSTATIPTSVTATPTLSLTNAGPLINYAYVVTSVDANGEESGPSTAATFVALNMAVTEGTMNINWSFATGAQSYNVYKADASYFGAVPAGATYGYVGTTTSNNFPDTNIAPDFSQTPPVAKNPFQGEGIASVTVTASGTYTSVPTVAFTGAASTIAASASAVLGVQGTPTIGAGGSGYAVNDLVTFTNNVVLAVATLSGSAVATWAPIGTNGSSGGQTTSGTTPSNPVTQLTTSGAGTGATANLVWGVSAVNVLNPGSGYVSVPTVTFSAGAAAGTAVLSPTSNGNPSVPGFFQQRLVLAAPIGSPQTFYMSKSGQYFNYDVSVITQADDAITGTLVSGVLNTIKSMVPQTSGLLMFTDRNSWLVNGGTGQGSAVTPSALVANAQSFNGVSDVPPIIANFDVLYVQSKGSIVRDSAYNIYANVYTGTDISAIASHLFFGFQVTEWAWAEEPFKVVWAIRNDGVMLTLTFLKEQEFIGWSHQSTAGLFKSVATVVEATATAGEVDAIYTVIQRTIRGQSLQYIERIAERTFPSGVADAWTVDCGIQYVGTPATSFTGAQFLGGQTVTGLADGVVIPPFTMPTTGAFTLSVAAAKVTVGLGFTCQLQTLPLELGDPTAQGKVKKINEVDVFVADTLGLSIGSSFNHLVPMKDFILGNVSSMLTGQDNQVVTGLTNGQGRTILDPTYTVPGQYCIQQSLPLPATVLGVVPNVTVGDDWGKRRE